MTRSLMFVAFCLLASVATAHAECAWMLWVRSPWIEPYWQIQGAQLSVQECTKNLAALAQKYRLAGKTVYEDAEERQAIWEKEEQFGWIHCFPDTFDPRGPKTR